MGKRLLPSATATAAAHWPFQCVLFSYTKLKVIPMKSPCYTLFFAIVGCTDDIFYCSVGGSETARRFAYSVRGVTGFNMSSSSGHVLGPPNCAQTGKTQYANHTTIRCAMGRGLCGASREAINPNGIKIGGHVVRSSVSQSTPKIHSLGSIVADRGCGSGNMPSGANQVGKALAKRDRLGDLTLLRL